MILHKARMAFALETTSDETEVSFMMLLVTMMTSSADLASSLIAR